MNLRKIASKRSTKLLILLIASLLISTTSAAVYYSMLAQPAVTITGAPIVFVLGSDAPTGSTLGSNGTWVSLALAAYPNVTLTYGDPLNISNTDASNSHQFRLRPVSITPASGASVGNFTSINFNVENAAGASQANVTYTVSGNAWSTPSATGYLTIPASTQWIISVSTAAVAGASSGNTANILISVDVQQ